MQVTHMGGKRGAWGRWLLVLLALVCCRGAIAATYTSASTTFGWIDSTSHTKVGFNTNPYKFNRSSGCATTPPVTDDTLSDAIPLGFTFVYGSVSHTALRIMTNGRLQFANTTCGAGTQSIGPPQTYPYGYPNASMNNTMKVFGVDLDPTNLADRSNYPSPSNKTSCATYATCYISYASLGTAPNRQFVVTWKSVPEWVNAANTSGSFDLQVILNEDGTFVYQYGAISHGGTGTAQIGWQLSTTDYEVMTFGAASEPPPGTAIIFYRPSVAPIADYRFEDGAWSPGGVGQVTDSAVGARPGTAFGLAQETASGKVCRGASIAANTSAATVDAVKSGVSIADAALNILGKGGIAFWYQGNAAWNSGTAAQLLDATTASGQWFYLAKTASGTLYFQVTDSTGAVWSVETPAQTFAAGTWQHVAITWNFNVLAGSNQDRLSIFINAGTPTVASFTSAGTVSAAAGYLYAGDNPSGFTGTKGTVNSANGTLDELQVYNYELNQGQVAGAKVLTHACPTFAIDHLELRHATWSGSACAPGTLAVVACANAACSSPYTSGVVATLSATGAATVWDAASGGATVVIGNTQSSTSKDFYTGAGTATFNATGTGVPVSPANPTKCNGSGGACTWTSTNGGLLLTVPASGVIVGGEPTAVAVQAVESTGTAPAVPCQPVKGLTSAGLKVWTTPSSPASFAPTSASAGYTVGGAPQAASAAAGAYVYTPQSVPGADNVTGFAFDATTATTTLWLRHMDTGSWGLNVRLDTATTALAPALSLSGTASVVSIPVGFGVAAAAVSAPAATQAACAAGPSAGCDTSAGAAAKVAAAGDAFSMTATAALWTAPGDADLSDNPVAPSYAGAVTLAPSLAAPAGGTTGTLGVTAVTLAGGQATSAAQFWTQAGAVRIYGSATYLGQGINLPGVGQQQNQNPVLGRFSAHHFAVAATAGCGTFTYSGQPFTALTITAMNGAVTAVQDGNYAGAFARDVTLSDANAFAGGSITAGGTVTAASFVAGQASAQPVYTFTTAKTGPTTIKLRATDTDAVVSAGEADSEIRSGRLSLANAYGSEFLPLTVPAQAQYWNGGWQQNRADNCTALFVPSAANAGLAFYPAVPNRNSPLSAADVVAESNGSTAASRQTVVSGDVKLKLRHPTIAAQGPGTGHFGYLDVIGANMVGAGAGAPTWLPLAGAPARVCFGICGPRSPIIHSRENY